MKFEQPAVMQNENLQQQQLPGTYATAQQVYPVQGYTTVQQGYAVQQGFAAQQATVLPQQQIMYPGQQVNMVQMRPYPTQQQYPTTQNTLGAPAAVIVKERYFGPITCLACAVTVLVFWPAAIFVPCCPCDERDLVYTNHYPVN